MGTTSDKLTYLNETKTLLKNKINLTGANITTDTFRSYPTKLQNALLDVWNNEGEPIFTNWGTKVNGEGTNVNLDNTINARMKITPKGNTTQTGTPTPSSPINVNVVSGDNEVVVCGKNLCNITSATGYGYSSGLPVGPAWDLTIDSFDSNNITYHTNNAGYIYALTNVIQLEPNTQYTISFSRTTTATNNQFFIYDYNNGTYTINFRDNNTNVFEKTFTTNSLGKIALAFGYNNTTTGTTTISNIQIEKGSTATTYEPYTSQNYPLYLGVENLYEGSQDWSGTWVNTDKWLDDTQTYNGLAVKKRYNSWSGLYKEINVVQGETYTYSFYAKSDTARQIAIYLTGGTGGMTPQSNSFTTTTDWVRYSITFNVLNTGTIRARVENTSDSTTNATYICGYQLEKNSKANSYTPYGTTPIQLCNIGNYVDFPFKAVNGDKYYDTLTQAQKDLLTYGKWYLHKEVGKVVLNGSENWYKSGNTSVDRFIIDSFFPTTNKDILSNRYQAIQSLDTSYPKIYNNSTQLVINHGVYGNLTLAQYKTWLSSNNVSVYYILATATDTQITDTNLINQLEQLKGAMSYEGQTNISSGFMIISASALGELS